MAKGQSNGAFSPEEAGERLRVILRGAFAGPPTPLKDIPKRAGGTRRVGTKKKKRRASAATSKSARPSP